MKNKKFIRCLIIVVIVAMMLTSSAFAAGKGNQGKGRYQAASFGFSRCIKRCVSAAEQHKLNVLVESANLKIEVLVRHAQRTPYNDVTWLLAAVDDIVAEVMRYADRIGATVLCEYTEYYIDGQYVLIDPLRVVNF